MQGDVLAACAAILGAGPGLLVVDNCEHLLDPVRDTVAAFLDGCPELTVLATSREPLGLTAESPFRLAPLPLPSAEGHAGPVERVPSVALFLDRAARVRPGLAPGPDELRLVADIVRRLDGIPLAIELAAGRLSTLSLTDLHDRLDRSLDLLGGGRPSVDARHRTLRAAMEWSHELLPEDEQRLFRHLSVFVDGVDLATAEDVAADLGLAGDPGGALAHLVDASMIEASFNGRARYRMLETLRRFGLDRLVAAREHDVAARRLLRWAVELTAWIDATVSTEREPEADLVLRRELGNLRAAWRLARRRGLLDEAAAMVVGLVEAYSWRDLSECGSWAEELVADPALAAHPRAAAVLGAASQAAGMRGDYRRGRPAGPRRPGAGGRRRSDLVLPYLAFGGRAVRRRVRRRRRALPRRGDASHPVDRELRARGARLDVHGRSRPGPGAQRADDGPGDRADPAGVRRACRR
jgi:predicted ATPase